MRKKQIIGLLIVFALINVVGISMIFFVTAETNNDNSINPFRTRDYIGIDGTSRVEGRTITYGQSIKGLNLATVQADPETSWIVEVSDDFDGTVYNQTFDCILQGEHCNIWIGLNPDVWDGGHFDRFSPNDPVTGEDTWYFAYPWSSIGIDAEAAAAPDPDGDGYYLPPGYQDWITMSDLERIMDEFDNNIHDCVLEHFGEYADRPGPLNDYKIQVLIFNMRDGLFYEPITAPWFIMGYFWSYVSNKYDSNIFHMDTYQWWRRLGEPTDIYYGLGSLPLQYEGTFAHEFQHLVHYDVDSSELSWVNEGCSMLAEWICGYGFSPGQISEYLIYFWDTSLVIWQGYLSNYGAVFLWTYYMWEHYGGDPLIWDIVHEENDGIDGWNTVLSEHGVTKTFDEIFQDWTIANYLDDTSQHNGIYGYYNLDIPSDNTEGYSISLVMDMWKSESNTPFFDWIIRSYPSTGLPYPYGSCLPYVANYIEFYKGGEAEIELNFDGNDYCGIEAHSGEYKWHSGGDAWAWYRLSETFNIPEGGATLNFWTCYEIELEWDFGYVEVYDQDTGLWCTLPGINTVADVGFNDGTDNPNCPGNESDWDLEPTGYYDAGLWNAFTGSSGGWYQESMDLAPFAGHTIELYFTYWTDPYTLEAGWYVDDIEITEISFFDDVEAGPGDWTAYNGWVRDNAVHDNNYEVNLITLRNVYDVKGDLWKTFKDITSVDLDHATEVGTEEFTLIDRSSIQQFVVMVVTNQPGYEHTFTTSYSFIAARK